MRMQGLIHSNSPNWSYIARIYKLSHAHCIVKYAFYALAEKSKKP